MSRAEIVDGVWTRHVPWRSSGKWRTDIFKSLLSDSQLEACRFVLEDGPVVAIPANELRRVVLNGPRFGARLIIDPVARTVDNEKVEMSVAPQR